MKEIVKTVKLTKKYKSADALKDFSITINQGDIYGLIGPNGAGKSTLIKILTGLSMQTSGEVFLFDGEELSSARRKIGSVIETPAFFKNMTATENLTYYATQFNCPKAKVEECLAMVKLGDVKDKKKFREYSLGMKQRLGLALALMHNPELIILDEPTNGLDPIGISDLRDTIKNLNEKGVTFVISSHILSELSQIATRFGIINNGQMVKEFSKEELNQMTSDQITISTPNAEELMNCLSKSNIVFSQNDGVFAIETDTVTVTDVAKLMIENNIIINSICRKEITLEEVFLTLLKQGV